MSQQILKALDCQTKALIDALQVKFTPIIGEGTCVLIDGTATVAAPMRTFNVQTGEFASDTVWLNPDTLMPIEGTEFIPTSHCNCPCEECVDPLTGCGGEALTCANGIILTVPEGDG